MPDPVVSVVVPTYARPDRLARLIAALEQQDIGQPYEVIVVDDGSPEATAAELDRLAAGTTLDLQVLRHESNRGPAVARNTGWIAARAPLVAFTDDDCVPQPGWLSGLVAGLANADVVQGFTQPDPAGVWGPWSRSVRAETQDFFPTCNVGYRRSLLVKLGGFDLAYRKACDDTDLAVRAQESGARTGFVDDAVVLHEVSPSSYAAWLREKPRWESVPLIVSRHPQLRSWMHNRWAWRETHPPALVAGLGLLVAATGAAVGIATRSAPAALVGIGGGAALLAPYTRLRTKQLPLPGIGPRRRWLLLPLALAGDLGEVGVLLRGSVRYRTLVL